MRCDRSVFSSLAEEKMPKMPQARADAEVSAGAGGAATAVADARLPRPAGAKAVAGAKAAKRAKAAAEDVLLIRILILGTLNKTLVFYCKKSWDMCAILININIDTFWRAKHVTLPSK